MNCPKCNYPQYCPCEACRKSHGQEIVWKNLYDGNILECGYCGHTMSEEDWLMEEWEQEMEGK